MPRRDKQQVHASLLEVGEALIAEHGIEAVHSNSIARAAGIGVGTFYSHFADKHAFARAIALAAWEELGARLEKAAADATSPAGEARLLTEVIVGYAAEQPARFRIAFERPRSGAGRGPSLAISLRPFERRFSELRARGQLAPGIDAAVAARAWWSMLTGTLVWWLEDPRRADSAALVETLVRLHPAIAAAPQARGSAP